MIANVLTIDLEEWFHLDERIVPPGEWDRLPGRAAQNTRALLDLLDACRVRGTFFALGWVAAIPSHFASGTSSLYRWRGTTAFFAAACLTTSCMTTHAYRCLARSPARSDLQAS